ncbi:MAG: C39 family peptidase [Candidatus Buchananbacteria bacterium]
MTKILKILIIPLFLFGCTNQAKLATKPTQIGIVAPVINQELANKNAPKLNSEMVVLDSDNSKIPVSHLLSVPFASQAPLGDWRPLYNEACEEASMIMVAKYFKQETLSAAIMNEEILKLVAWEQKQGYAIDLTASEVVKILADYFSINARAVKTVTPELIKGELLKGNPIIIPVAGRELGNPNFRNPGPLYHMLVIRGYNDKSFITNDPGTKNGSGYQYLYQRLIEAIHDWNQGQVSNGQAVIIVVSGLLK